MARRPLPVLAVLLSLFATWGIAPAQEPAAQPNPAKPNPAQPAAGEGDVLQWIKQLDADGFPDREAASDQLAAAGARAIAALIEAAESGAPESAARAVNVLSEHLSKSDAELKAAAKSALEKIAQGDNPVAARRAKSALEESEKPPEANLNARVLPLRIFGGGIQGGIQIRGGGQIQVQVAQNNGVQVRRVTVANNNGVKQIDAEEGNRKVKIKDDPNNGIEIEVTETKDGKEATQKYQAKNPQELKKNHPEAHKIYEQYNNGPAQAPVAPAADAARRITEMRIDSLQRSLESLQRSLGQLENGLGQETTKEIKQHLENVKKELSEAKKKLSGEPVARPPQP